MPRPVWSGSLSFGLVNVPVRLYTATRSEDVHFHEMTKAGERVRHKRVSAETGEEVDHDDLVKGYEVSSGSYVLFDPEELDEVAPQQTHAIAIEDFVDLDEIDPIYFERTYYLGPGKEANAAKPYELLRRSLEESGKVAIGRFVMRSKEHLAAVRPGPDGTLLLDSLYFADEVRGADVVDHDPDTVDLSDREREIASVLIDALTSEWQPDKYHDTYRDELLSIIEAKAKGEAVVTQEAPAESNVVDLMAALEASVAAARDRGSAPDRKAKGAKRASKRPSNRRATSSSSRRRAASD